ncbi:hypothetical protein RA280_20085 [Cupriavidus sp. CV2]|uniref:hypothetical protein n=1 Tax=Cupriavidus ulmosensis TaxID=3065913 RepID=UPI00296B32D7|nr:hypothetical protein [Cupriavidus sp. CV2]MDW3684003.1 hypothetical protein [Cupriavidus sp. CV2]
MKNDLSHWVLVMHFTRREAAYLAVGADPQLSDHPPEIEGKARLIEREIGNAADRALEYAGSFVRGMDEPMDPLAPDIWEYSDVPFLYLPSSELRANVAEVLSDPQNVPILSRDDPWFTESFYGLDLAVWFGPSGFEPIFDFERKRIRTVAPKDATDTSDAWSRGKHDTALLRHLAAAADRYWKPIAVGGNYDPSDRTTAPTNDQVIEWLVARGVSKRVAEVMAQILRADGLPTGPRK